jgi:hypothetical protein
MVRVRGRIRVRVRVRERVRVKRTRILKSSLKSYCMTLTLLMLAFSNWASPTGGGVINIIVAEGRPLVKKKGKG